MVLVKMLQMMVVKVENVMCCDAFGYNRLFALYMAHLLQYVVFVLC